MENSTWSGTCPHCGCPIEGIHYEGCNRPQNIANKNIYNSLEKPIEYINEVNWFASIGYNNDINIVNKINEIIEVVNKLNKMRISGVSLEDENWDIIDKYEI